VAKKLHDAVVRFNTCWNEQ